VKRRKKGRAIIIKNKQGRGRRKKGRAIITPSMLSNIAGSKSG
jgi:hypothetical protein